jgi:hypothetical protein
MMNRTFSAVLLPSLMTVAGSGAFAETATYTGSASTTVSKTVLPLGNGASVIMAASRGVAAISTSPPTLLEMNCAGMGLLTAENSHQTDFYCTFKENENDSLDVKGVDGPEGGTATVIGGSGKWKGATGDGTFKRVSSTESSSSSTFELNISTP